jgi:hypothetical protein
MSASDAERDRTEPKPETKDAPDLSALIKLAGQNEPHLANALTLVFSALLRTMIEQERAKQPAPVRRPATDTVEPSEAEIEAAARAFWRYDLCGMLLYTGEHVLCDDERIPPYNRRLRCECRAKSRATLEAAAGERSQVAPAKPNGGVARSLAALTLAFQKTRPASQPTCSMARDVWVANAAPSVEATFSLDPGLVPTLPAAEPALADEPDSEPAMTWQPIKTAPKPHADENQRRHHLLYDPNVGVTTGFWLDDAWGGSWYRTSPSHELLTPTHWMPLPEPPGD